MRYEVLQVKNTDKSEFQIYDKKQDDWVTFELSLEQAEAVAKVLNDMGPLEPGWYWVKAGGGADWKCRRLHGGGIWEVNSQGDPEVIGPRIPEPEEE